MIMIHLLSSHTFLLTQHFTRIHILAISTLFTSFPTLKHTITRKKNKIIIFKFTLKFFDVDTFKQRCQPRFHFVVELYNRQRTDEEKLEKIIERLRKEGKKQLEEEQVQSQSD